MTSINTILVFVSINSHIVNIYFRAGELDIDIALRTLEYLNTEEDYVPWVAAIRQLSYVDRMLKRTSLYGTFKVRG